RSQDVPEPAHHVREHPAAKPGDVERPNPVADHLPVELRHEAARRIVIAVLVEEEHLRQAPECPETARLDAYPPERSAVRFPVASDGQSATWLGSAHLGPRR